MTLWNPYEEQYLREHYLKLPAQKIAATLGRSLSSVRFKAFKMGLCFDRRAEMGPAFEKFLRAKHAKGWSDQEIAAAWGTHRHTVFNWRKRLRLTSNMNTQHHRKKMKAVHRRWLRECGVKSLVYIREVSRELRHLCESRPPLR